MAKENISNGYDLADLETLEIPSTKPRALLAHFGPGLILAMTGMGTSHLVTAPTAGGRFAYALLWCIPVSYIFKYYGFEMAFRFTNATGKSLLEAYSTAWKKWPLWYVMITTLLQCAIGQAGRLIAAAAVTYYVFTINMGFSFPLETYALLLGLISVVTILRGEYKVVEIIIKIMAGILLASSFAVYFVSPAPISEMGHFLILETPDGSWLVIAALLGLLPTGLDRSLQASEWGKAKQVGLAKARPSLEDAGLVPRFDPFTSSRDDLSIDIQNMSPHVRKYCRQWFKLGLWDFRFGHVISALVATIFLIMAAVWMYPSEVEGQGFIGEISTIFTESVGAWMMTVFVFGAFAATFSGSFVYFDGWPRTVGACCRNLFKPTARLSGIGHNHHVTDEYKKKWYSEYNIYRITMIYSLVASVTLIIGFPRPVFMVLVASTLALFMAPVIFFLNLYYCMVIIPKNDKVFYPNRFDRWFGWTSFSIFTGIIIILIYWNIWNPLLGE